MFKKIIATAICAVMVAGFSANAQTATTVTSEKTECCKKAAKKECANAEKKCCKKDSVAGKCCKKDASAAKCCKKDSADRKCCKKFEGQPCKKDSLQGRPCRKAMSKDSLKMQDVSKCKKVEKACCKKDKE